MVDIKVDKGEVKICLDGEVKAVSYEMSQVGKSLAQRNRLVADSFIFGMCDKISKEDMIDTIEKAYKSYEIGEKVKKSLDTASLDEALEELIKNLFGGGGQE